MTTKASATTLPNTPPERLNPKEETMGHRTSHILACAAAGAAALAAGTAQAQSLTLMTGPQGGSWYPLGGAIQAIAEANLDGVTVQVMPGGGVANVQGVQGGRTDLGFANSVSTVDAINGREPFEGPADNVCNVATLYPQYFQIVTTADAGIESIADIAGRSIATQARGNTAEQITRQLLEVLGQTPEDMADYHQVSYTDAVSLMKDGNAEVFTLGTTVPAGSIMDLASARDIRLVNMDDDTFAAMKELNPGYNLLTIAGGSYPGVDEDVQVIGYATHVVARCDLDADLVYNLLDSIYANIGDLQAIARAMEGITPADMGAETGVPLHPGAERWYHDQGVM